MPTKDTVKLSAKRARNFQKHKSERVLWNANYKRRIRAECLVAYGNACNCCGETEKRFLTLEHKRHDGQVHRRMFHDTYGAMRDLKRRGWPKDDYELLCWNCQMATRYGYPCPHKFRSIPNMTKEDLISIVRAAARKHDLDEALACAVVEQESLWNTFAIRYEPAFFDHYVSPIPKLTATEARARAVSWGLFQVMGQVARERGFGGPFLSELCQPEVGAEIGCTHLNGKLAAAGGDVTKALLLWNGGGNSNYPAEVLARLKNYQ